MWYLTKSKKHYVISKLRTNSDWPFENCWRSRTCRSLAKCFRNRDKHFGPHVSKWNPVEWSFSTYITLIKVIISLLDTAPLYIFLKKEALYSVPFYVPWIFASDFSFPYIALETCAGCFWCLALCFLFVLIYNTCM